MKKVRIKVVDTLTFEGEIPLSAYPDGATVEDIIAIEKDADLAEIEWDHTERLVFAEIVETKE